MSELLKYVASKDQEAQDKYGQLEKDFKHLLDLAYSNCYTINLETIRANDKQIIEMYEKYYHIGGK